LPARRPVRSPKRWRGLAAFATARLIGPEEELGGWKRQDSALPWAVPEAEHGGRRTRTDARSRCRRTCANTASAKPPWATSGDPVDHATSAKGRDSWRYGILRPLPFFPGSSLLSRQLHDWQSHEGPMNRCLIPPPQLLATRHRRPRAPPGNRIRRGVSRPGTFPGTSLASPSGSWSGGESGGLGPGALPILRSSPPFSVHANIFRSFPGASAVVRSWPARCSRGPLTQDLY